MNCKNCKNWVFGRCIVSNLVVGPDMLCNAWELSQSYEMVDMQFATFDDKELQERIAELEAENAELKERVAMLDVTAVFKSLGEMGYIEQVTNLRQLLTDLEAQLCWIPVSERLPELDQDVFAIVDGVIDIGHFYEQFDGEIYFSSDVRGAMLVATHWMDIPDLPEEV